MKTRIYVIIAAFLLSFVSCGNNKDKELKEIVRVLNESGTGMAGDLIGIDKVEYDGHAVTLTYTVADGVIDYDGVQANNESFRQNMLVGYANNPDKGLKMMIDAIVKAGADLIVVFNSESNEVVSMRFTAEELKNNTPSASSDPMVLLKTMADNGRLQTPTVVDDGMVMTDVFLDEHYYTYVYECDESEYDMDYWEEIKDEIKESIMEDVLDDNDITTKAMCELLKKVRYGLAFKYVGSSSGKVCMVYIEPDEL